MAGKGVQLDWDIVSCAICLDALKDPVTVPCGHNYCMDCINTYWKAERGQQTYVCPQCRKVFTSRPVLTKNAMLAAIVEELEKTGVHEAPADRSHAGSGDVACDICVTLKAVKSCLVCLVSFCENHLQPHHQMQPLMKHKLVEPCQYLQEKACVSHAEVKTMFCRTDQQCICRLCSAESHKDHDTVSAEAERREKQRNLAVRQLKIQQMIRERKDDVTLLQQRVEVINHSANKAVKDSHQILTQLIDFLENQRCEVEKQVRLHQEAEVSRVKEAEQKLECEIVELSSREDELRRILHTEDDNQFLQRSALLLPLSPAGDPSRFNKSSTGYFEDVTAALSKITKTCQKIFRKNMAKISQGRAEKNSFLQSEPQSRPDFLEYSCELTLDADTAHMQLHLSAGNRTATVKSQSVNYPTHPGRFTQCCQVLSKKSMTGRCYWEVKWDGPAVYIAVAYADVKRDGPWTQSGFGSTDKSWALYCDNAKYIFCHNSCTTPVSGPPSSTLGAYLDHSTGLLAFYSVTSKALTLLHKVQTTFTQPLHAGFSFYNYPGNKVEILKKRKR